MTLIEKRHIRVITLVKPYLNMPPSFGGLFGLTLQSKVFASISLKQKHYHTDLYKKAKIAVSVMIMTTWSSRKKVPFNL